MHNVEVISSAGNPTGNCGDICLDKQMNAPKRNKGLQEQSFNDKESICSFDLTTLDHSPGLQEEENQETGDSASLPDIAP